MLNLPITVDVFAGGLLLGRMSALHPNKMFETRCEEMKKQSKVTVTGMSISNMSGHDRRTGDNMQFQKVRDMWSPFGEKS